MAEKYNSEDKFTWEKGDIVFENDGKGNGKPKLSPEELRKLLEQLQPEKNRAADVKSEH